MFSAFAKQQAYDALSQEKGFQDCECLIDRDCCAESPAPAPAPATVRTRALWTFAFVVVLSSLAVNVLLLLHVSGLSGRQSRYVERTSTYLSPIDENVPVKWEPTDFNGSFARETIYRRPASPEVDAAWDTLGVKPFFLGVEPSQAEKYGLHRGQVKLNEASGGGVIANVEVFHQLHCLNLLRKGSYWDFEYYWRKEHEEDEGGVFSGDEDGIRQHFSHCLDMLRQRIMCTADTALIGQVWLNRTTATIDFNQQSMCRNFRDIRDWVEVNAIAGGSSHVMVKFQAGDEIVDEVP